MVAFSDVEEHDGFLTDRELRRTHHHVAEPADLPARDPEDDRVAGSAFQIRPHVECHQGIHALAVVARFDRRLDHAAVGDDVRTVHDLAKLGRNNHRRAEHHGHGTHQHQHANAMEHVRQSIPRLLSWPAPSA
jgi:hypothetical protein